MIFSVPSSDLFVAQSTTIQIQNTELNTARSTKNRPIPTTPAGAPAPLEVVVCCARKSRFIALVYRLASALQMEIGAFAFGLQNRAIGLRTHLPIFFP